MTQHKPIPEMVLEDAQGRCKWCGRFMCVCFELNQRTEQRLLNGEQLGFANILAFLMGRF